MKKTFLFCVWMAVWSCMAVAQTPSPTATATPLPTLPVDTCYAVPASTANLVSIDAHSGAETIVGPTGAGTTIRGMAIPAVGNDLLAATASQLGTLDTATGTYAPIGSFGTAVNGDLGPIVLDDLVAVTQDSGDGVLYGVHRTTLDPDTCFAVAATGDTLVRVDRASGIGVSVGATSNGIEAVALVGSTLYAAIGDQLGVIDRTTGTFSARAATFGQGDPGAVAFDDVRGLTYDATTYRLFAVNREAAADDELFVVNLTSGAHVPLQFNAASDDYVTIAGGSCVSPVDIEALAMDPSGTTLYGSDGDDLVTIDAASGACNVVGAFGGFGPAIAITGMGFADDGTLYGSDATRLFTIDTGTGAATVVGAGIGVGADYRGLDCPVALPDVLFRIDPTTGSHVPLHFDFGFSDYALVDGGGCGTEIEALAYDQYNDVLLGIDATNDRLVDIDPLDGFCSSALPNPLGVADIASMTWATATNEVYAAGSSTLYTVDPIGGTASVFAALSAGVGYEALVCPTQLCKPVLRKSHHKTGYSGKTLEYRLFWLNPCTGVTPTGVVITDPLPSGLTLLSAQSAQASIQVVDDVVTLSDAVLPKGPAAEARITVRIDAPAGTRIDNVATLRDGSGRTVSARDRLAVREDKNTGKTLELGGHKKTRIGARATVTARYKRTEASATLVMVLPEGVILEAADPEPTTQVADVVTWTGLAEPAGKVKVRLLVAGDLVTPNLLSVAATLDDGDGDPVSHSWEIRVPETGGGSVSVGSAALKMSLPRRARAGLTTRLSASFRKIAGEAAVTLRLPAEMQVESAWPDGAEVVGDEVRWVGLSGPNGKVKVTAAIVPEAASGSLLTVGASLSTTGGDSAGATATLAVR